MEILKQVQKIDLKTRLVEGLMTGQYHSVFKGQGIEFSDLHEYQPGDDIRTIDWNVTARFNHPYVKQYIEERDTRVYIVFDLSGSSNFGNTVSKKYKSIELIASLMFAAMRNNDAIGLVLGSNHIEKYVPPKKGKKHALTLLSTLLSFEPQQKQTNLEEILKKTASLIRKRSVIFIVSDFISPAFTTPLKLLKNKHDVIAVSVTDEREYDIPDIGLIELEDEETGDQVLVDTSDPEFRENYRKLMKRQKSKLKKTFKKLNTDFIEVITDEPYIVPLQKFFKKRR